MLKNFFLICLAMVLSVHCAAAAKDKGLPEAERIKIAVEISDRSRYTELNASDLLGVFLNDRLIEKNLLNVVVTKTFPAPNQNRNDGLIIDEDRPVEQKPPAENIGELLIFDAVELPRTDSPAKIFDDKAYLDIGVDYLVRCEIVGIGARKVDDKTIGMITGVIGGGLSLGGAGSSNRDKALRRVGAGVGLLGLGSLLEVTKRTALNTVVNMQFIDVKTGKVLFQENFIGQALKHHNPRKGFDNVWTEAYTESVEDSAKRIAKRVNKYVDKVIIKGKSDKSFMPKKFSVGL